MLPVMHNTCDRQHINYDSAVVRKPWGYEYLMYQNDKVGLWVLHLSPGASTSLHCHPRKKTGLVLLSGEAHLSYLNDGVHLKPLDRVMIRPGLFHSTKAVSPDGIVLLEIETPRDKENLVRLEDAYGREAKPYEGIEADEPLMPDALKLSVPQPGEEVMHTFHGCQLRLGNWSDLAELDQVDPSCVLMLLDGGLFSKEGEPILAAGDVVTPQTLSRLSKSFPAPTGIQLLIISRS